MLCAANDDRRDNNVHGRIKMRHLLALLVTAGIGFSTAAHAQSALPYPDINDASHATKDDNDFFRVFFVAKSPHKPDEMMVHFARDKAL
jgi:hypothetical protein